MSLDLYLECADCRHELFSANITHNLGKMAEEAGIYQALWRPQPGELAGNIAPIVEEGLEKLLARPEYFRQFNASNGWGLYEHFVEFVSNVRDACKRYPKATVRASV